VLALDPALFPAEVVLATTVGATPQAQETQPAPAGKIDDAIAIKIRARLRRQGVTKKQVAGINFNPESSYQEQYISALKQLP
jgi:hypothetical protein